MVRRSPHIVRLLLLVWSLVVSFPSLGQEEEISEPPTPWWREVEVTGGEMEKSPFWAMVSSVLLPGGGQFYTESHYRGLLFFLAQGTLLGMTLHEHVKAEDCWRRYERTGNSEDHDDALRHYEQRRNLLWWDAGVWFLSAADAYVNAHMYKFKQGGRTAFLIEPKEDGFELLLSLGF